MLKSYRVGWWGGVVAHKILVSAQGPLVLRLRVWGQGLTIDAAFLEPTKTDLCLARDMLRISQIEHTYIYLWVMSYFKYYSKSDIFFKVYPKDM